MITTSAERSAYQERGEKEARKSRKRIDDSLETRFEMDSRMRFARFNAAQD